MTAPGLAGSSLAVLPHVGIRANMVSSFLKPVVIPSNRRNPQREAFLTCLVPLRRVLSSGKKASTQAEWRGAPRQHGPGSGDICPTARPRRGRKRRATTAHSRDPIRRGRAPICSPLAFVALLPPTAPQDGRGVPVSLGARSTAPACPPGPPRGLHLNGNPRGIIFRRERVFTLLSGYWSLSLPSTW